ncbi:NADH dehydrogenase [Desulfuromusa kysingii]|uniref:NADH:ubiquinone reductase (non-electrogenic) n=1 Tax=Desulfuromusa kysingii TaxID=37625 RepID=A0A1H4AZ73_9BACT|nr:NAD(P)/FAD-dependent oxidoreductase [Desulfuromusa kysingii]SEA40922.1 NADH dehydrogenase [Desulfuromusa kysingii]
MDTAHVSSQKKPHVVIIGGGFAGLHCARGLADADVKITLADQHNYYLFQPLLYQVATAALSPADIAAPIRNILRKQQNVSVILARVISIDVKNKLVKFQHGDLAYDYLVLATGATHSYFGRDTWEQLAPGLKTVDDALEIRRRVLLAYEAAEWEADNQARQAELTFVVVGGGPTGVEMSGALQEIAAKTIPKDFRHIDTTTARIILVEAADRLLMALPKELGEQALRDLQKMGVQVRLNCRVTEMREGEVQIGDEILPAKNVIWAAGVRGSKLAETLNVELDRQGRVLVEDDLSVPGHAEIMVIGDLSHVSNSKTGKPVPGVAPAAIQMGRYVAASICSHLAGKKQPAFEYHDKGTMATIGRNRAVAAIAGRHFSGFFAWLIWSLVHIFPLIGFRSKLSVIFAWVLSYFSLNKSARLITGQSTTQITKAMSSGNRETTMEKDPAEKNIHA